MAATVLFVEYDDARGVLSGQAFSSIWSMAFSKTSTRTFSLPGGLRRHGKQIVLAASPKTQHFRFLKRPQDGIGHEPPDFVNLDMIVVIVVEEVTA
ncbi:MAG: hypothetical protein WDN06_12770 [Asticcacaulis sp.]